MLIKYHNDINCDLNNKKINNSIKTKLNLIKRISYTHINNIEKNEREININASKLNTNGLNYYSDKTISSALKSNNKNKSLKKSYSNRFKWSTNNCYINLNPNENECLFFLILKLLKCVWSRYILKLTNQNLILIDENN